MARSAVAVFSLDAEGCSPLTRAAETGDVSEVRAWARIAYAFLDVPDGRGLTVMNVVARHRDAVLLQELSSFDPWVSSTAVLDASSGDEEGWRALEAHPPRWSRAELIHHRAELSAAIARDDADFIDALEDEPFAAAVLHCPNEDGQPPLTEAVLSRRLMACDRLARSMLVASSERDGSGRSPLDHAAAMEDRSLVELLLGMDAALDDEARRSLEARFGLAREDAARPRPRSVSAWDQAVEALREIEGGPFRALGIDGDRLVLDRSRPEPLPLAGDDWTDQVVAFSSFLDDASDAHLDLEPAARATSSFSREARALLARLHAEAMGHLPLTPDFQLVVLDHED